MNKVYIPTSYNYIEAYLTFACAMNCHYCINKFDDKPMYKDMKSDDWIRALNRIESRNNLPITLGGGEPTMHPEFYTIVKNIREDINLDLLTNGSFDIREFMKEIPPMRFMRNAKYASIRFSYHPGYSDSSILLAKVVRMMQEGYSVGVWAVEHPEAKKDIKRVAKIAKDIGIDFRTKAFLGEYKGKLYGTYKYKKAILQSVKPCMCKPSELLIAPDGSIHKCHYKLYSNLGLYGNINDKEVNLIDTHWPCNSYGRCNPCDLKIKYDRFQKSGHCAVDIKEVT